MPYIDLNTAGQMFPKPLGKAAVMRRIKDGIDGIRLQAINDGNKYFTRKEWIDEFIERISSRGFTHRMRVKQIPNEVTVASFYAKMDACRRA